MGHIDLYYQHRVDTRFADDDYRSKIPRFSPDHMAHNVAMA